MNRAVYFFMAAVIMAAATASLASSAVQARPAGPEVDSTSVQPIGSSPSTYWGELSDVDTRLATSWEESATNVAFSCPAGTSWKEIPEGVVNITAPSWGLFGERDGRPSGVVHTSFVGITNWVTETVHFGWGPFGDSGLGGRFKAMPARAYRAGWGCMPNPNAAAAGALKEAKAQANAGVKSLLQLEPPCLESYALARGHVLEWYGSWFVVIPRGAGADYDAYGRFACPGVVSPTPVASATGGATATANTPAPTPTGGTVVNTPTASASATAGPSPTPCVHDPYPGPGTPVSRCPATATATATGTTGATNTPTSTATATSTSTSATPTASATATATRTPTPRGGRGRYFLPVVLQFKP